LGCPFDRGLHLLDGTIDHRHRFWSYSFHHGCQHLNYFFDNIGCPLLVDCPSDGPSCGTLDCACGLLTYPLNGHARHHTRKSSVYGHWGSRPGLLDCHPNDFDEGLLANGFVHV
jgi:hypothetical protein